MTDPYKPQPDEPVDGETNRDEAQANAADADAAAEGNDDAR